MALFTLAFFHDFPELFLSSWILLFTLKISMAQRKELHQRGLEENEKNDAYNTHEPGNQGSSSYSKNRTNCMM